MWRPTMVLTGVLLLGGCAVTPMPSTAYLPHGAFGSNADNDLMAINTAAWAWTDPARTHGNLINSIRAVLAVEYLGGQLTSDPRWTWVSPLTKLDMLEAREAVRAAVGIAPDAPSQTVADALLRLSVTPAGPAADQIIRPPVFTLPPKEVLARLDDLPRIPIASRASYMASMQQFPGNDFMRVMP